MSEEERQDDALPRQPADDGHGGDESFDAEPGDERSLLTAYALGELDDARREEVAARLRESTDERQAVDDLARLGKLLRGAAAQSPANPASAVRSDRSAELREALLVRLADPPQSQVSLRVPTAVPEESPRRRFWLPLSLAAALAVTCGTLFALLKTKHGEQVAARREPSPSRRVETARLDMITDLTEVETTDSSLVQRLDKSAEDRVADGEASFFKTSSAEARRRTPDEEETESVLPKMRTAAGSSALGAAADGPAPPGLAAGPTEPKPGRPADFDGDVQLRARPARGGSRFAMQSRGNQAESMPRDDFALVPRQGEEPREPDLQRQQVAAEGEVQERIKREFSEQEQRLRHAGGKQEVQFGETQSGGRYSTSGQGPRIIVQEEEEADLSKVGGLSVGGRGLSETPRPGDTDSFFAYGGISAANGESYPTLVETPFRKPTEYPLSTFSVDVDSASYTNVRRFLNSRAMPPRDAVRIEELINYFQYHYPQPDGDVPFSITSDVADCPWQTQHRLLRVGLKGREIPADERPASNLVFLLDVSGSMDAPNKLPLVKEAMSLLVDRLTENDRVAIVVYAGNSGLVLPPTNGQNKDVIRGAISRLVASGSTNGGQGLQMAYDTAQAHFIKGGTNRVILATDGDFNVGVVDQNDLVRLIEEKARGGVFLSALGFGIGNLKDGTLEKLADKGNGNYAYIDTLGEARRVLVEQLSGTLVTIAKDVKLQIEFNPAQAAEYRLIGYEDRLMPDQDFHDDRKDAGEIGAGHSVTALYEIIPSVAAVQAGVELKYQRSENSADPKLTAAAARGELATIKLRYKEPDGEQSRLIEHVVTDRRPPVAEASQDMSFAAAVAAFGMLLRDSPYRGDASYQKVLSLAEQGLAGDASGYRSEFVQLVRQAREISGKE
jgi:Ca-activated chloride channel family protein